jgi:hypothetical protein
MLLSSGCRLSDEKRPADQVVQYLPGGIPPTFPGLGSVTTGLGIAGSAVLAAIACGSDGRLAGRGAGGG